MQLIIWLKIIWNNKTWKIQIASKATMEVTKQRKSNKRMRHTWTSSQKKPTNEKKNINFNTKEGFECKIDIISHIILWLLKLYILLCVYELTMMIKAITWNDDAFDILKSISSIKKESEKKSSNVFLLSVCFLESYERNKIR